MKIIIPLAGKGTRLRPHTHTVAKPLFHLAGAPVLGHIFNQIKDVNVEEVIFIVGYLGDQIREYVKDQNFSFKSTFVEQKEMLGQAHAVYLAKNLIKEDDDAVIWFVDTISDANLNKISGTEADALIYVKEIEDPRRFGQIKIDEFNNILQIKEKADPPISNLVNIGIYYIKNCGKLMTAIKVLLDKNMQTKGEFYLMDAFQLMIDDGAKFKGETINVWEDCGKSDATLLANKYLIKVMKNKSCKAVGTEFIEPVYIEEGAKISGSKIGPFVSIGKNCIIENSRISDSIIGNDVTIKESELIDSIIGNKSTVLKCSNSLDIGEDCRVE